MILPVDLVSDRPFYTGRTTLESCSMARVGHIGAYIFGSGFVAILAFMQFDPTDFVALDTGAAVLAHPFQSLIPIEVFIAITTLGSVTGIVALTLLCVVFVRKNSFLVLRLLFLILATSGSVQIVKSLIGRIRPQALPWIGPFHSYSFPSGHAATSMALFGFVGVVWYLRSKNTSQRFLAITLSGILILLVGVSRIVLSAHYASDVLAGYILGALWLCVVFALPKMR